MGMLGMLSVGVGERESGGLGVGGESRLEAFELGTLTSLEALRMLRGATAWAAKGAGEMGRWEGRGPAGRAGLGWSDCIVVDEEEERKESQRRVKSAQARSTCYRRHKHVAHVAIAHPSSPGLTSPPISLPPRRERGNGRSRPTAGPDTHLAS